MLRSTLSVNYWGDNISIDDLRLQWLPSTLLLVVGRSQNQGWSLPKRLLKYLACPPVLELWYSSRITVLDVDLGLMQKRLSNSNNPSRTLKPFSQFSMITELCRSMIQVLVVFSSRNCPSQSGRGAHVKNWSWTDLISSWSDMTLDRASAAKFSCPLRYIIVNEYPKSVMAHNSFA